MVDFLVFGGRGLLGQAFIRVLKSSSKSYIATKTNSDASCSNMIVYDVFSAIDLSRFIEEINPKIILNCIGSTNIEYCEKNRIVSKKLNYEFPVKLSSISCLLGIKFINIGTDHFSTNIFKPRKESERYYTENFYANIKMRAEKEILINNNSALSIRTNFFSNYSRSSGSLFNWFINKFAKGESFSGFNDVIFTPISAKILSEGIIELIKKNATGTYHLGGPEVISKYQFGQIIGDIYGYSLKIMNSRSIKDFPELTKRTNYLALDSGLFHQTTAFEMPTLYEMVEGEYRDHVRISSK